MTWLAATADGGTARDRVFGLRPEAYARLRELEATVWDGRAVHPAVLELCRLRIADLLGCPAEDASRRVVPGLDARIAALAQWPTSPAFDHVDRACLAFAEQYVLDPHGMTDEAFAELRAHLPPPAIATLALAVALFDAGMRFRLALGIAEEA